MSAQPISFVVHGTVQVFNTIPEQSPLPYEREQEYDGLGEIAHIKPEITFNTSRTDKNGRRLPDGIEIRFGTARPTEATRQAMKDHGYQFSEKQVIWYAKDTPSSRSLAEKWAGEDVEVDTTQYVKHHFWAPVRSSREYDQLRNRTEFFLKTDPPKNFYSKSFLERAVIVNDMIAKGLLFFKKFFNRAVDEDGGEEPGASADSIADKLEALANGMQKTIDEKLDPPIGQMNRTARRNRIAQGIREEGLALQETQRFLYALANAHRSGEINRFPLLARVRSKTHCGLFSLLEEALQHRSGEETYERMYSSRAEELNTLGIDSLNRWYAAVEQKKALIEQHSPSNVSSTTQLRIRELEDKVWAMNIPGFFPTPRPLVAQMIELAELEAHHSVLDPSAGKGDILDAVAEQYGNKNDLFACEINSTLLEILTLKGYFLWGRDFLEQQPGRGYFDRILMNPPFEHEQDADHVTHALKFLGPRGRLVAIVVEGLFFRKNKKATAFREMLHLKNAYVSEPIDNAFNKAFNKTNVRVRIIAINEDNSPFSTPSANWKREPFTSDEPVIEEDPAPPVAPVPTNMKLLELEAEAEIELLRMRVEHQRRKQQNGMSGIADDARLQQLRRKARNMNYWTVFDFK